MKFNFTMQKSAKYLYLQNKNKNKTINMLQNIKNDKCLPFVDKDKKIEDKIITITI